MTVEGASVRGRVAFNRAIGMGPAARVVLGFVAVAGPLAFAVACAGRVGPLPFVAAVLIPTPAMLALATLIWRRSWPAVEVVSRLNLDADADWRKLTGGKRPRTVQAARSWLLRHPEGSVPLHLIAVALLNAERTQEARDVIGRLPTGRPAELHVRRDLEMGLAVGEGRTVEAEAAAADVAARSDGGTSAELLQIHLARHASILAQSRGLDGLEELAAVRPQLGSLTGDWARAVVVSRFWFAIASFLVGAWILVAMALSGAASGGAFWL